MADVTIRIKIPTLRTSDFTLVLTCLLQAFTTQAPFMFQLSIATLWALPTQLFDELVSPLFTQSLPNAS